MKGNTNYEYNKAEIGHSLNQYFNNAIVAYPLDTDVVYYLTMDETNYPGVIFYDKVKTQTELEKLFETVRSTVLVKQPAEESKLIYAMGLVFTAVCCYAASALLFADDVTGIGVFDDVFAVALLSLGAYYWGMALQSLTPCGT